MGDFGNAKILGGIGAILMLVGGLVYDFVPIIGLIMVFLAIKQIADAFKDEAIFKNFLLFVILYVIATVAIVGILFYSIGELSYLSSIDYSETTDTSAFFDEFSDVLIICLSGWIIFWILNIIGALFLKKSFESIAQYTKVDLFKTTALVFLIGAVLLVIGIGAFIIFIAEILMIVAFFQLPDSLSEVGMGEGSGRVCPGCGRPIPIDAVVCPYCGRDFRPK